MQKVFKSIIVFICLLISISSYSQNAILLLKFEDAEKAFNQGDYTTAIKLINEVETAAGVSSKTLYLRIVTEDKLFAGGQNLYDNIIEYEKLESLRLAAKQYLDAMASEGVDDKYREIYEITKELDEFPKSKAEWELGRENIEKAKAEERLAAQEAAKKKAASRKAAELFQLNAGAISLEEATLHQVSKRLTTNAPGAARVVILRPKEDTRKMSQVLYLNDEMLDKKLNPGEYIEFAFSPGLLKVGRTDANNRNKVSTGVKLLGGVVGMAAGSAKSIAESDQLFYVELAAGKTHYITSKISSQKKIIFDKVSERVGKSILSSLKPAKD